MSDVYGQISEAMYTPSDKRYDKQHKLLHNYFARKVKQSQGKYDQRFEQQE